MTHDSIWRYACLRDLQVPDPGPTRFKWSKLYASLGDGSHSYTFHEQEKHLDWMRIGAFYFDSDIAMLAERLSLLVKIRPQDATEKMLGACGASILRNIKKGIWVTDLQLVRCPVCELDKCDGDVVVASRTAKDTSPLAFVWCLFLKEYPSTTKNCLHVGTMQTLDARHIELFLSEDFQNGSWKYELVGSHKIEKPMNAAS